MSSVSLENLKINTIEETKVKGIYAFEPLPTGFGYTLGNAMRRVLLTSIKGAAATSVKVSGASHQFTTIPGVKEDVVELTLNLKRLRFKLHNVATTVVTLKKKGAGDVTGADIELSSDVELMNKDLHIATLSDSKAEINLEIVVEAGIGYSPMEERQSSKIGVIVLDALFTPVLRANFSVEPTRYGDKVDLDKVVITLETDGSILPKDAVKEAANTLKNYYEILARWDSKTSTPDAKVKREEKDVNEGREDVAVEELPLQTRTINALKKNGIETMLQLANKSDEEIGDIKNLGEKSLEEIKSLLIKEGFR